MVHLQRLLNHRWEEREKRGDERREGMRGSSKRGSNRLSRQAWWSASKSIPWNLRTKLFSIRSALCHFLSRSRDIMSSRLGSLHLRFRLLLHKGPFERHLRGVDLTIRHVSKHTDCFHCNLQVGLGLALRQLCSECCGCKSFATRCL